MRKWFVWLALPSLLLSACADDGGGGDPGEVLASAFEATGEEDATTITITLASTAESLTAGGELSEEQAETILGSSLVFSGTKTEDPADASARIALEVPGTDGVEMLVIGTDLYLRADVMGLAAAFGQDTSGIDAFVQQSDASFLEAAVEGRFIRFEGADQLGRQLGADPGQLTQQQQRLLEEFGAALKADAEITSEGEDDVGEHFRVSIPLRALYRRLIEFASQAGGALPPGSLPPESEVPEGDVVADIWVSDGKVAQIELDFLQFAQLADEEVPAGVEELALRIALSYEAPELTPPEDAVTITEEDIAALMGGFFGMPGGGTTVPASPGDGGGAEIDCSLYEDLPPETFEGLPPETLQQLEAICPGVVPGN